MLRKLHRFISGNTLIVDIQPKVKHFNLEPFLFGPWEDTDICSESCRLLQTRTCEEVNPRSSCQDISPYRNGQTACHKDPCPGRGCGKRNVNFNVSIFLDLYTFGNWSKPGPYINLETDEELYVQTILVPCMFLRHASSI